MRVVAVSCTGSTEPPVVDVLKALAQFVGAAAEVVPTVVAHAHIAAGEAASALLMVSARLQAESPVVDGMTCVAVGTGDAFDAFGEFVNAA